MSAEEKQIDELIKFGEEAPLSSLSALYNNKFASDEFVAAVVELYAYAKSKNVRITFSGSDGLTYLDTNIKEELIFYKDVKNAKLVHENMNTRNPVRKAQDSTCPDWQVESKYSNTTGRDEQYVARRVGPTSTNPMAVIRLSRPKYF
jgi:hypothetical protein